MLAILAVLVVLRSFVALLGSLDVPTQSAVGAGTGEGIDIEVLGVVKMELAVADGISCKR